MLNRTQADLDSVTVRTRFFGGRSAAAVAADMPLLPVDAPGLPPPGPSFLRFAQTLGDAPPPAPVKGRKKVPYRPAGPYLTALVRSAVYQCGTTVPLGPPDQAEPYQFQCGVLASGDPAGDPYGPAQCRLMVVGKCLGRQELQAGRPFYGPSSKPLWDAWGESGLPLPAKATPVFLTNLIRFIPPLAVMSTLPKDWVKDGLHLLYQEIALCRPEVVYVLGADALKALLGPRAKVEDYRGRVADLAVDCRPMTDSPPDVHTARLVVADHPAAVWRDTDKYPQFLAATRTVARTLGHIPAVAGVPLDHKPVYTTAELEAAVAESVAASAGGGYVSFDCEWDGGHPTDPGAYLYTVQWSHAPGHARVAFLRRCGGGLNAALPLETAVPLLRQLFVKAPARGARLVGHFAKADLPWLESIGVDLYPYFVGPDDDPNPDGRDRLYDWQKCYYQGAFDTYVGAHAWEETLKRKLEVLCANVLGAERWDVDMMSWKVEYCKEKKIKTSQLSGYGNCPENRILPYAAMDTDWSGRLYLFLNGDPRAGTTGALDRDRFGNSARQIFATRMRAWGAWAEMERYGILIDRDHHRVSREAIITRRTELITELRATAAWPDFTPAKPRHRVELLFGETYHAPDVPMQRPPGGLSLYLTPYKSTGKTGDRLWADALYRANKDDGPAPAPSTDKESMIHLARQHPVVSLLRDIDFLGTALKSTFRPPDAIPEPDEDDDETTADPDAGPDEEEHYSKGLLAEVCADGRVRSTFGLVETGRGSSSKPNFQNLGGSVDEQFDRILGWGGKAAPDHPNARRKFITRAVCLAQPGWYLIWADLKGAEIAAAAWGSGDGILLEHARRNNLEEDDPDWLDLHSDLAKAAFKLELTLTEIKKKHKALRTAAKRSRFGHYYGASPETILRQVLEEIADATLEQIEAIVAAHDQMYPGLAAFFAACRDRPARQGWMCNGFGGYRRFRPAGDRDRQAAQGREAQNWSCQGLVADAMNRGLGNLWYELRRRRMRGRIILSVHDSVGIEAPPEEVAPVVDELLPLCLTDRVPVVPTTLDGVPLARGPYRFGIDVEVCRSWGVTLKDEEWRPAVAAAAGKF